MTKRVPAIILVDPREHAKASQKENNTNNAANTYWETDIGQIFLGQLSFQLFDIVIGRS
jgi:hypothetical protein